MSHVIEGTITKFHGEDKPEHSPHKLIINDYWIIEIFNFINFSEMRKGERIKLYVTPEPSIILWDRTYYTPSNKQSGHYFYNSHHIITDNISIFDNYSPDAIIYCQDKERILDIMKELNIGIPFIRKILGTPINTNNIINITVNIINGTDMYFSTEDDRKALYKLAIKWSTGISPDTIHGNHYETIVNHYINKVPKDTIKKYCLDYIKKLPFLLTPWYTQLKLFGLTDKQQKTLFKMRRHGILKRIRLSGEIDDYNIKEKSPELELIYKKFIYNPYAYYRIPLWIADNIMYQTKREVCTRSRHIGKISRYVWKYQSEYNHTGTPFNKLEEKFPGFQEYINELEDEYGIVSDKNMLFTWQALQDEKEVFEFLKYRVRLTVHEPLDYFKYEDLDEKQSSAVNHAIHDKLSIITGGAGTGKTKCIGKIVKYCAKKNFKYNVIAVAAIAVEHIRNVLGKYSYKMKKYGEERRKEWLVKTVCSYKYTTLCNPEEKLDYLIIDESSMLDLHTFAKICRRIPNDTHIILVGDINQLSPIKYGRPFEDIIVSNNFPVTRLEKNYRQLENNDYISKNANNIILGNYSPEQGNNFKLYNFCPFGNYIKRLIEKSKPFFSDYKSYKFLSPKKDTVKYCNYIISETLYNQNNISIIITIHTENYGKLDTKFSIGDPVVFLKNDNKLEIYNGTQGIIENFVYVNNIPSQLYLSEENTTLDNGIYMVVNVDNRCIYVKLKNSEERNKYKISNVDMSYCMTIHKGQGSQWDHIYYILENYGSNRFFHKRMAYTGITRARKSCTIIQDKPNQFLSVANTDIYEHYGKLKERINEKNLVPGTKVFNSIIVPPLIKNKL